MACGGWFDHWAAATASGGLEARRYQGSKAGLPDILSVPFKIGDFGWHLSLSEMLFNCGGTVRLNKPFSAEIGEHCQIGETLTTASP